MRNLIIFLLLLSSFACSQSKDIQDFFLLQQYKDSVRQTIDSLSKKLPPKASSSTKLCLQRLYPMLVLKLDHEMIN
jgi:Tfp pilus assembly protein PilP